MFILHLCFDGNFVSDSYFTFEKFYPKQNLFLINKAYDECKIVKDREHFLALPFEKRNLARIQVLCDEYKVDTIVLHGLCSSFVSLLKFLFKRRTYKVYWLFWGYELYVSLAQLGKYKLVDDRLSPFSLMSYITPGKYNLLLRKLLGKQIFCKVLQQAIPYINYFCFWNYADYMLLQKYYNTHIEFRFFAYSAVVRENVSALLDSSTLPVKKSKTILINHQASLTGNHSTLMKRIAYLDKDNLYTKMVPLSYGSNHIREVVLKIGHRLFLDKFHPILNYMPALEYFNLISQVEVAILGARRQEASGNIINLLSNGTKVFLREDNNLLHYYREKGFIIFSYEKDLNSVDDLYPLSIEEQEHNKKCRVENRLYYDQFMPFLF